MKKFVKDFESIYYSYLNHINIDLKEFENEWLTETITETNIERFRFELIIVSQIGCSMESFVEYVALSMEKILSNMPRVQQVEYAIVRHNINVK